jgi:integrase
MATKLTPRAIASLKPDAQARYVNDAVIPGLALRIPAIDSDGDKSWSLRYRLNGRQRRLTHGSLKVLSLADARKRAKDELKRVSSGSDPAQMKQERREADTVEDFKTVYIEKYAKPNKRGWKIDEMRLRKDVLPLWKHRLMRDITRRDVRELIDKKAEQAPIVANRVRALLHKFFAVAIDHDVVDVNPVTGTPKPVKKESRRDRVLSHDELRTFWTATNALPAEMRAAFRLRLITAQRGGEVFGMRWQDVDLDNGWWTIPMIASKNKLSHRVPLSTMALDILQELRTKTDERLNAQKKPKPAVYVFRYARGKRQQAEAVSTFGIDDFRGHDLRRTAASLMTSAGTSRLVVSKILNHAESGITAVYDRHSYDPEKRVALDAWARTLTGIIEQK